MCKSLGQIDEQKKELKTKTGVCGQMYVNSFCESLLTIYGCDADDILLPLIYLFWLVVFVCNISEIEWNEMRGCNEFI